MRFLLALVLSVGFSASAWAGPWTGAARDTTERVTRDAAPRAQARTASAVAAPQPGSCEIGRATGTINANQVAATVFTTGTLFYGPGGDSLYRVPQESRLSPIFASSVWIAGLVGGELRVAGTTYGQGGTNNDYFEFWPGPLNDDGSLVNPDCSVYDRIYVVSRRDIQDYDAGGTPTRDLADWPANLGAPVIDGDGNPDNYNLAGGDRPDIIGDQSLWYILNDVGNLHRTTESEPIGVEVKIQAFSFARDNALGQTTFYKYTIDYKGTEPLTGAYLSVFSDPDLGNAVDDFVGVDPDESIGYVYNADEVDDGQNGYGTAPPAVGYDFFQGPAVDSDGDGDVDEDDERLGLTSFMYFINGDANRGDPGNAAEYYRIMQGRWADGTAMTANGTGYNQGGEVTRFAFPGNPVNRSFWSEENNGSGRNVPGDRRFVLSTGPFTINPGDSQEIVFGIVYGRGNSRLSSITALRAADVFAQAAYDLDFDLPVPAPPPVLCDRADRAGPNSRLAGSGTCFYASEFDGQVTLNWGYAPEDEAYLGQYESKGYRFEGFNVYRYPTGSFNRADRQLVATYDKVNGVTTLQNIFFDPEVGDNVPVLAARGTDSGLAYSYFAPNLTNYTDYYYGLTTYIVDPTAPQERVIESAPRFLTVRPSSITAARGGSANRATFGTTIPLATNSAVIGGGQAFADVVDPAQVTGAEYRVRYYSYQCQAGTPDDATDDRTIVTYNIENVTTGAVLFNGATYAETADDIPDDQEGGVCEIALTDEAANNPVFAAQGLQFRVTAPPSGVNGIVEIANTAGIDPCGPNAFSPAGCPDPGNNVQRSFGGAGDYGFYHNGPAGSEATVGAFAPNDFEIRIVPIEEGSWVYYPFTTGRITKMPFQIWDIGIVPVGAENDPSDDVRLIPNMFADAGSDAAGECVFAFNGPQTFDGAAGSGNSTQRIYAYYPVEGATYETWAAAAEAAVADTPNGCDIEADGDGASDLIDFGDPRGRPIQRDVFVQRGVDDPTDLIGTIVRYITFDPVQAGDTFVFNTAGLSQETAVGYTQEEADRIGVVPNPYYGFSEYESGNTERVARFTNLPERATIRIFTVSGTLIRTLTKDSNQRSFDWNLQTENGLPVASGLYLIHVELPDSGLERVIKFGVVNRRTQIEIL